MGFFHRRFLCLHTWSSNLPVQVKYRSQYTRKVQSRLSFIPKQKAVLNLERGNHSQPDGHFKISLASLPVVVSSRLYYMYQHKAAVVPLTALHCSTTTSQVQNEPPASADSRCTARRRTWTCSVHVDLRQSHDSPPKKSYGRAEKCRSVG